MKILKLQNFPNCYGIKMAQDLMMNELLGASFVDSVDIYNDASKLPDNLFGLVALKAIEPIIDHIWGRFETEFKKEMDKKRGEPFPCKECPVLGGCLLSAVLLIADDEQWC